MTPFSRVVGVHPNRYMFFNLSFLPANLLVAFYFPFTAAISPSGLQFWWSGIVAFVSHREPLASPILCKNGRDRARGQQHRRRKLIAEGFNHSKRIIVCCRWKVQRTFASPYAFVHRWSMGAVFFLFLLKLKFMTKKFVVCSYL